MFECLGKDVCNESLIQTLRLSVNSFFIINLQNQLNHDCFIFFFQEQRGMPEIKEEPEEEPVVPPKKLPRVPIKQ